MYRLYYFIMSLLLTFFISCSEPNQNILVDKLATNKTLALFNNLRSISASKVLFGHQETTAYGIGWVNEGGKNRSDVKSVCGDFPAIYGWDLGDIGQEKNLDGVPFNQIKVLIKDAYGRGGVNTISFHQDNPVSGGHSWDTTRAVPHLYQVVQIM